MTAPEKQAQTILIAGGTGMIGKHLAEKWRAAGHRVKVLTRRPSDPAGGLYYWNAGRGEIDADAAADVTVLVNLAGAGIADKRWSDDRKKVLIDSRVRTTEFLWKTFWLSPTLKHYISASGINCYGYSGGERLHPETDGFGADTLSQIVLKWERAADLFAEKCPVAKVRTATVLEKGAGALKALAKPVKLGFGAPLGSGAQFMPWIHMADLVDIYDHILTHRLDGTYNANAGNVSNRELTKEIARALHRPLWLPKVPAGLLRLLLGEMSEMLLLSVKADNTFIRSTGYDFRFSSVRSALEDMYK
jgi:uncharacterized protein